MAASTTGIEWTDSTWNPVTGCAKVSPGCARCYAEATAARLHRMGLPKYARGFRPTLHEQSLDEPRKWRMPRRIFVCSMSDLLQEEVPDEYIERVVQVMREAPQHVYQVLTKRPFRLRELAERGLEWPANAWIGTSIESDDYTWRANQLADAVPETAVRWVSAEPLLGPLPSLRMDRIDWIVIGGETGPGARAMQRGWVLDLISRAGRADPAVPVFFKRWGGRRFGGDRLVEGQLHERFPDDKAPWRLPGVTERDLRAPVLADGRAAGGSMVLGSGAPRGLL